MPNDSLEWTAEFMNHECQSASNIKTGDETKPIQFISFIYKEMKRPYT